jgi:4'-phosphopantetheinyl transferase
MGEGLDVWLIPLVGERPPAMDHILSPDERARAGRFAGETLRDRFVCGRAAMRLLLGQSLGVDPQGLVFTYGAAGKPALAGEPGLHFNLAHSHELAVLAVTRLAPVGIDIEWCRPLPDRDAVARRFFAQTESAALAALPEEQRDAAFYAGWTRKEAYLKAVGTGLSQDLDGFCVELRPARPAGLLSIGGDFRAARGWTIADLPLPEGYRGACAVPATAPQMRVVPFTWGSFSVSGSSATGLPTGMIS